MQVQILLKDKSLLTIFAASSSRNIKMQIKNDKEIWDKLIKIRNTTLHWRNSDNSRLFTLITTNGDKETRKNM